jgi:DNA gyrase inhibitor GyrI
MWIALVILVAAGALVLAGCKATRAGYESATYQVIRSRGKFQVREYPALTVVETPMASPGNGADGSFNRLFRFLTGGNETKQKIAMTTPVFMSGGGPNASMAFVMPARLKIADVPRPKDEQLRVRELEAGRFAVLRYRGRRNPGNEAQSLERLRAWMKTEGLKEVSPPIYGYFDPPWTPAFLRRNEVMVRTGSGV